MRDLLALTKPRVTLLVLATTAGGLWLAPGRPSAWTTILMLLATAMCVGSANTLNCWLERDLDAMMERTRTRPLPDGRLDHRLALVAGAALAVVSVPALTLLVNPLTGLLGAFAFATYVCVYTPMKTRSPNALLVGAVPGALPPLMGRTAMTGTLDLPGLVLFAILFFWQVPHFIAISILRQDEYARAGMKVLPVVRGETVAKLHAVVFAAALLPASLLLVPLGVAGRGYFIAASVLGTAFLAWSLAGLKRTAGRRWARGFFIASLVYLPALFGALALDATWT